MRVYLACLSVFMLVPSLLLAAVKPAVAFTAFALLAAVTAWRSLTVTVLIDGAVLHVRNRYRTTRIPLSDVSRIAERPWMGTGPSVVTIRWPRRLLPWGLALEGSMTESADAGNRSSDFARELRARAPQSTLAGYDTRW